MRFCLTILFVKIFLSAFSISGLTDARSISLGGSRNVAKGIAAVYNNPAGLYKLNKYEAGVFYENKFFIKELNISSIAFATSTSYGNLGLHYVHTGYQNYKEQSYGFTYGYQFENKMAVGLGMELLNNARLEFENRHELIFEVGILMPFSEKITFGTHIYNPVLSKESSDKQQNFPSSMSLGLIYKESDRILLNFEINKSTAQSVIFRGGLEYNFSDPIFLRVGLSNNDQLLAIGVGVKFKDLLLNVTSIYHQVLGISPNISLIYEIK